MKRIAVCCLVLGFLAVSASAYLVHEEPEEDDETVRGKRQQNGVAVIDSIFNIPITAIKQTSAAAQTLSPSNAATIDTVLKIPVTTLEAVSRLIKDRQQQNRYPSETTPLSASRPSRTPQRRYDVATTTTTATTTPAINEALRSRREEIKRRVEAQREQQRVYQEQLHRRRFAQLEQYNRRMQQHIVDEDERTHHRFYRDPFGFNALTKWIVGPHGVFNGHAGHGDGHVYQFFNAQKPLHFGGHSSPQQQQQPQGIHHPFPTKPTLPLGATSTTTGSTTISNSDGSTTTTTTSSITSPAGPTHNYQVHEVVDEGLNPFTWPNWFGIINVLSSTAQTYSDDRIQNKIAPKKTKVRFGEPPIQNKIAPKDEDTSNYYKSKYAKARKNSLALEEELTGNEIDSDVVSAEINLGSSERAGRVLFPSN